jgi:serine/threonine protein kinase
MATIAALIIAGFMVIKYRQHLEKIKPLDFATQFERMLKMGDVSAQLHDKGKKPREIRRKALVLLERLGHGAFGEVWKALLDESATGGSPEYTVAAKTLIDQDASSDATSDFLIEATVMSQLPPHRNLVTIIGVITSGAPLVLVLSYCEHGSALAVLKKLKEEGEPVTCADKVKMAAEVATGMEHLTSNDFVHRDLAARNVLLSSGAEGSMVAKVADFGLCRCSQQSGIADENGEEEQYYRSTRGVFAIRWTPPEAMETLVFTESSDVWSFGITLVEIFQDGVQPYLGLSNPEVMRFVMSGQRHPKPKSCSTVVYNVLMKCWAIESDDLSSQHAKGIRPTFHELAIELSTLALETPESIYSPPSSGNDETTTDNENNAVNAANIYEYTNGSGAVGATSFAFSAGGAGQQHANEHVVPNKGLLPARSLSQDGFYEAPNLLPARSLSQDGFYEAPNDVVPQPAMHSGPGAQSPSVSDGEIYEAVVNTFTAIPTQSQQPTLHSAHRGAGQPGAVVLDQEEDLSKLPPWFHPHASRLDSEIKLKEFNCKGNSAFLVRRRGPGSFAMSVVLNKKVCHRLIEREAGGAYLVDNRKQSRTTGALWGSTLHTVIANLTSSVEWSTEFGVSKIEPLPWRGEAATGNADTGIGVSNEKEPATLFASRAFGLALASQFDEIGSDYAGSKAEASSSGEADLDNASSATVTTGTRGTEIESLRVACQSFEIGSDYAGSKAEASSSGDAELQDVPSIKATANYSETKLLTMIDNDSECLDI